MIKAQALLQNIKNEEDLYDDQKRINNNLELKLNLKFRFARKEKNGRGTSKRKNGYIYIF